MQTDPLTYDARTIAALLDLSAAAIPELEQLRVDPNRLADTPQLQEFLDQTEPLMADLTPIPQTGYTAYRRFREDGDRKEYETAYFGKRQRLAAIALRLFLGIESALPLQHLLNDYVWAICEETSWVLPAHERCRIDLFAAETAFMLADLLNLMGDMLNAELRSRVRTEIEQRIFDPYLRFHQLEWWYLGENNWNGVCNSSVAAAFVLLEPEPQRLAEALAIAFNSLRHFLNIAFEPDGGSNEGVAYWNYGLINLIALSELLHARSRGAIDLLSSEHMRTIAAYPAKIQLSGSHFAAFSDCDETLSFQPGILMRLMQRTDETSLSNLLVQTVAPREHWRLTMMLRNLLWWDGSRPEQITLEDVLLPDCGVARISSPLADGKSLVVAIKAGHNAENHNQNDIGSFVVHIDGENLLTDPGRGLYSRHYFGPQRYDNIFASSYGHSVPRVAGQLQSAGRQYAGQLLGISETEQGKCIAVEFACAYADKQLSSLRREICLERQGSILLSDSFGYSSDTIDIEEALISWLPISVAGSTARIQGQRHSLQLQIQEPASAEFQLEELEQASRENAKPDILKRLSVQLPIGSERFVVRMDIA